MSVEKAFTVLYSTTDASVVSASTLCIGLIMLTGLTLIPLAAAALKAVWDFEMKGVPGFALGFVKDSISDGTDKALELIAKKAEIGFAD